MDDIKRLLWQYAEKYETADFLPDDPSWFMHQVKGADNQEVIAFIASCLSYGSRKQFMPKIQFFLDVSKNNVYDWLLSGRFKQDVPDDDEKCFYRLILSQNKNQKRDANTPNITRKTITHPSNNQ